MVAACAAVAVVVAGRRRGGRARRRAVSTTAATTSPTVTSSTTSTTVATTTTEADDHHDHRAAIDWPALRRTARRGPSSRRPGWSSRCSARNADGTFVARAPCGGEVTVTGTPLDGANVVLDPGHGGDEPGAVGPAGTTEKAVNLAIAQDAKRQLEALGATVVLTRTADYRITLVSRAAIATSLQAAAVRVDPPQRRAGRAAGGAGRRDVLPDRLAGVEAGVRAPVRGARAGVLPLRHRVGGRSRRRRQVPAPRRRRRLLRHPQPLRRGAGRAVGGRLHQQRRRGGSCSPTRPSRRSRPGPSRNAIVRFVTSHDPGSGFVEPYPRTEPAGPGGGATGCTDPPLG